MEEKLIDCLNKSGFKYVNNVCINIHEMTSLEFISAIVDIEEEFNIQFSDELLSFEMLTSINSLVQIIKAIKNDSVVL